MPPLIPRWDDPDDVKWGLLPFAIYRGVLSLILGYDPVAERQRKRLAEESHENYQRLSPVEHDAYDHIREHHLRQAVEPETGEVDGTNGAVGEGGACGCPPDGDRSI